MRFSFSMILFIFGVFGDEVQTVEVKKGDSVTLHTDHSKSQTDDIKWYRDDGLIARINPSQICTDVQCDAGNERFRDRLQLNHQTGSLTITNIRTTDSGLYKLKIGSSHRRKHPPRHSVLLFKEEPEEVEEPDMEN